MVKWICSECGAEFKGPMDKAIDLGWVKYDARAGPEGKMKRLIVVGCPTHRQEISAKVQAFLEAEALDKHNKET